MSKKLIVLDIDECLVHASDVKLDIPHDFEAEWCYVYKRPHVDRFLAFCKEHFDVALWTTAGWMHADLIVAELFPDDYKLEFVYSSRNCTRRYDCEEFREHYIKNFRKLKRKGFDLSKVIMVDDTPQKHVRNYGNLVQVSEFVGDQDDDELHHLMEYLLILKDCENIRAIEKRNWRTRLRNYK